MPDQTGRPLRIIEIGDKPFIKSAFPDETLFFCTYAVAPKTDENAGIFNISFRSIGKLRRLLRDETVSLIVCHPTFSAPWGLRAIGRALFSRRILQGYFPVIRSFGPQFVRGELAAPLIVLDQDDFPLINRCNLFLLERSALFFKRELPVDRWRVFLKTAHRDLPTQRFRQSPRFIRMVEKLRPISLGLPLGHPAQFPECPGKTSDVFFAGRIDGSSWVRTTGMQDLLELRAKGVKVDFVESPVSREEFYQRCAASWLTWSPEGFGWDCFRHYESLACGSVPVCSFPTIERHRPLVGGEHAIFYSGERGGLADAVTKALADKNRLAQLARQGRAYVLAHHTPLALATYIVEQGLAFGRRSGADGLP